MTRADVADGPDGAPRLRIAVRDTGIGIDPASHDAVFEMFHKTYPRIRIRVLDESSSDVLLAVTRCDADFGLTYIGTQEADIDFTPLIEEAFVLACSSAHPLATQKKVAWKDLGEYGYIALAQGSGNRLLIDQALATAAGRPRWFCEVNHVPALVSLVSAGVGIGVVPRMAPPPPPTAGRSAAPPPYWGGPAWADPPT